MGTGLCLETKMYISSRLEIYHRHRFAVIHLEHIGVVEARTDADVSLRYDMEQIQIRFQNEGSQGYIPRTTPKRVTVGPPPYLSPTWKSH